MGLTGMLPPDLQKQLLAQLSQPGAGVPRVGVGTQQSPTPFDTLQPQAPKLGGNNVMLPGGTASAGVPGVQLSATPPKQAGSVAARGIGSLPGAVIAVKQQMQRSKSEKARQLTGQYLAMKNSADPKIQQAADALLADPKNHKIFAKATTDPSSPEYAGVQMAYRDMVAQEQQSQAMEEMRAKIQEQQGRAQQQAAMAQQEQQRARLYGRQADIAGTATEKDQFQEQQKNLRAQMQVNARLQQSRQSIDAMLQRTKATVESLENRAKLHEQNANYRAGLHERGADKRAGMRQQQNQALNAMLKQYKNIQSEITNLDREQKAAQDDLIKNPISSWVTGQDEQFQANSAQIDAKRQGLEAQLAALDASVDAMTAGGVIPPPAAAPTVPSEPIGVTPPAGAKVYDFTK